MCLKTRLARRGVTHVAGLFFATTGTDVRLCFALPTAAVRTGKGNHTIPGGRIHQLGARRFEHTHDAMLRELKEETGVGPETILSLCGVGAPVTHYPAQGGVKLVQGFVGLVSTPCDQPRLVGEIAAVAWPTRDAWLPTIRTMNEHKQALVLQLMERAMRVRQIYPCVRREVSRFLDECGSQAFA